MQASIGNTEEVVTADVLRWRLHTVADDVKDRRHRPKSANVVFDNMIAGIEILPWTAMVIMVETPKMIAVTMPLHLRRSAFPTCSLSLSPPRARSMGPCPVIRDAPVTDRARSRSSPRRHRTVDKDYIRLTAATCSFVGIYTLL